MMKLAAKPISLANKDATEVSASANKISKHFRQIEASEEWVTASSALSDKNNELTKEENTDLKKLMKPLNKIIETAPVCWPA